MLVGLSLLLATTLGSEFIPRIDEGELEMDVKRLPSTSIDYSRDLNMEIEKFLQNFQKLNLLYLELVGESQQQSQPEQMKLVL